MDIQRHPSSVVKLAKEMKKLIDAYWGRQISEKEMKEHIIYFAKYENKKLFRGPEYSPTVKQRLGKKRMEVVEKMLEGHQYRI